MGRAVLRLLLACALLFDVVTGDASTGVIPGCSVVDAFPASREYYVNSYNIWFNCLLLESTSVVVHGEYFD